MTQGSPTKRLFLVLVVFAVVASSAAVPVAATDHGTKTNCDADAAHNPYIDADVTKTSHEMSWTALEYENDSGEVEAIPGELNTSETNPHQFTFSDVETSAYDEFPVNVGTENVNTIMDQRNWSTSSTGTVTVSVNNVTTATGVDAIEIDATGVGSTERANGTFDAFRITSDVDKRWLQVIADVDTLDSANDPMVQIRVEDDDGDFVSATLDPNGNASTGNTMANSTGEGYVFQQQIGDMTVNGTEGDGTLDEINATKVVVIADNANVDIAAFSVERTSPWDLGTELKDTDGDGNNETYEPLDVNQSGDVRRDTLDSLDGAFDAATIHDLTIPIKVYSCDFSQPSDYERFNASSENATDYPSFDSIVNDTRRLALPSAFDLSYSNTELRDVEPLPSNRYRTVEYTDAVGETDFQNVSFDNDVTSSYSSQGTEVTLTTDVTAGEEMAVRYDYLVTADEKDSVFAAQGGGAAPIEEDTGGFFSTAIGQISAVIGAILGFFGLRKMGS